MFRVARWKLISVAVAVLFGVLFSLPNVLPKSVTDSLPEWIPAPRLNLGLDLQGGSYLLYSVDVAALQVEQLTNRVEDVRRVLQTDKIDFSALGVANGAVRVRITNAGQMDLALKDIRKLVQPTTVNGVVDMNVATGPDQTVVLTSNPDAARVLAARAVDQSIEIIRKRIDKLGTREPLITKQGVDRIVVEAAGESDPERLKAVIGRTAKLTFQMVDTQASVDDAIAGRLPPGDVLLPSDDKHYPRGVVVKRRVEISGEMLTNAQQSYDQQTGAPDIAFALNGQGTARFADVTTRNVGKPFAIVLDGHVMSAPNINGPITGGSGVITGNFSQQEAADLANILQSGALPAPLKVEAQRQVGAELGADAIKSGTTALAIGAVAIFVFIILAYGLFGVFAAAALVLNILMIVAAMSITQATLTLPGVAGLILTLAVAVDANVLIYERMRDEARAGRNALLAADHGYKLAWPSIFDANVTTMISALIMLGLGSGPVKGFAWTLMIGVLTSVYTAIIVTQVLIGWWFKLARPKQLPI